MTETDAKEEAYRLLDWRPLSEPPKDEQWVLLRWASGRVMRVYWSGWNTFEQEMLTYRPDLAGLPMWKPCIE